MDFLEKEQDTVTVVFANDLLDEMKSFTIKTLDPGPGPEFQNRVIEMVKEFISDTPHYETTVLFL